MSHLAGTLDIGTVKILPTAYASDNNAILFNEPRNYVDFVEPFHWKVPRVTSLCRGHRYVQYSYTPNPERRYSITDRHLDSHQSNTDELSQKLSSTPMGDRTSFDVIITRK